MLFLAIEHQLDRQLRDPGQLGADDALRVGRELAAEAAAHVLGDGVDVGLRDAEALRESLRALNHRLGRDPRGQLVAVPLADGAVRLEADVADHVRRVGRLDDVRGLVEAGGDVAGLLGAALLGVAAGKHQRRVRRHGLLDVREVRQHLVADADQPRRVERALFGVGRDGGDRIALIHHLRAGLRVGQHRLDAGRFFRGGQVDRHHPRVRVRRADHLAVDHAGAVDVVGVAGAAADLVRSVEPLDRRADQHRLLGPRILVSHAPPPSLSPSARLP